jgi:transcriptional regulator with XRE-family HTH domain
MADKNYADKFRELGARYRKIRLQRSMVQEDVLDYGFSVRHYQQLEAGRPHSITTLLRIAEMYDVDAVKLLKGLYSKKKRNRKK